MAAKRKTTAGRGVRRDRTVQEYVHDTFKVKGKLREPTACTECRAVYHKGRWIWGKVPAGAHKAVCPACRRTRDKVPAGMVTLGGAFLQGHKREILGLARNAEKQESRQHALSRIMDITDRAGTILINTTDTHLARRIGDALFDAYEGTLTLRYAKGQERVRVSWDR